MSQVELRQLGALVDSGTIEIFNGFPFGGHNENGSGVPHMRPFNVTTHGEVNLDQIKCIPHEAASGRQRLRRGDILFNNTNTKELVGKCALWDSDSEPVFSNHMTRIRVRDGSCDPAYLSFAILHHWMTGKSEMLARAHVAQASIMGERFREIEVPLPNQAVQRATAEALTRVRRSCNSDLRQAKHAQQLKAAAMREVFSRGLRGEPQKETEIGLVPESWEVVTFDRVREWLQYGTSTRCSVEPAAHAVLRIPNVESGKVDYSVLKYCNLPDDEAQKYLLEEGDILFIRTNGVLERLGSCAVYLGTPNRALFASYLIRARLKQCAVSRYVAYFYGSERGTTLVASRATPAADGKYNLNTGTIDSLPLPLPRTREEQEEIVTVIDAIDRKIDIHRRKRTLLEDLFKSMLHNLMTGDVCAADLDLSALPAATAAEATP